MKRHSKVGQNAVNPVNAIVAHEIFDKSKISMYKCKSLVVDAVAIGIKVLIHAIEMPCGPQVFYDFTTVSSTSNGHVNIVAIGLDGECVDAGLEQSRDMINLTIHV